jgi:putative polyhydroxyalkanoate system protein
MSNIHIKHPYTLLPDEARKRVEEIAKDLKKEYKIDYSWQGDHLHFRRSGASGSLELGDGIIELNIKLGMILRPLKGKIEDSIRKNLVKEFGAGKAT